MKRMLIIHFLVFVGDSFLWPKVRHLISASLFSCPVESSFLPHLVHMPEVVVPFYWYALSPTFYPEGYLDRVVDELVWQMPEERWCQHGC